MIKKYYHISTKFAMIQKDTEMKINGPFGLGQIIKIALRVQSPSNIKMGDN